MTIAPLPLLVLMFDKNKTKLYIFKIKKHLKKLAIGFPAPAGNNVLKQ